MKKLILFAVLYSCCTNVQSQSIVYNPAQNQKFYELFNQFEDFKILKVDQEGFWNQANNGSIHIEFSDISWDIVLTESSLLNGEYGLTRKVQLESGEIATPYRGYVSGYDQSQVSLTLGRDFIYGYVRLEEETYYFEPLRYQSDQPSDDLVLFYKVSDIIPGPVRTCAAHFDQQKREQLENSPQLQSAGVTGDCWEVELAIASDYLMFQRYGSIAEVENHNIGVMNDVGTDYVGAFDDDIQFNIVVQYIVDCNGCDPWTSSNNIEVFLDSFRDWAEGGGFGIDYDLGQLWTTRNFSGPSIGLAWVGAICNSYNYHVLEDFSTNADLLRVLVSHEIGHNFNCFHDASGSPFIMAPSVQNTDQWSPNSINVISDYIVNRASLSNCLSPCGSGSDQPIADFSSDVQLICVGEQVSFFDESIDADSWNWSFPGGTPTSSILQNPVIQYNTSGVYNVTLEAGNENGADTEIKFGYIEVIEYPIASFDFNQNGLQVDFINNSSFGDSYFWDFGDGDFSLEENPTHFYNLDGNYLVELTVTNGCSEDIFELVVPVGVPPVADFSTDVTVACPGDQIQFTDQSTNNSESRSWVFEGGNPATSTDLNPLVTYPTSGTFRVELTVTNDFGEDVLIEPNYITILDEVHAEYGYAVNGSTVDFTNLSTNWTSLLWDFGDGETSTMENPSHTYTTEGAYLVSLEASNMCGISTIDSVITVGSSPIAGFSSAEIEICPGDQIQYIDMSTNATSWFWTFEGGNPSTSDQQNPVVAYAQSGAFDVSLVAFNVLGSDESAIIDYVTVLPEPIADFDFAVNAFTVNFDNLSSDATAVSWDFGDGETSTMENPSHTYTSEGTYIVSLEVSNMCGISTIDSMVTIGSGPVAGFSSESIEICPDDQIQYVDVSTNATSWFWTFEGGNPSTSDQQNPIVTYAQSGTFDVSLVASNNLGSDESSIIDYVTVLREPIANFDFVVNNFTVDFTNLSSDATLASWDFGDSNTSSEYSPSHTYNSEGVYEVELTVTNSCNESIYRQMISIGDDPIAGFTTDMTTTCPDKEIQFIDESTNATAWAWSFPGGMPSISDEANPVVTYSASGTYDVGLTVTNSLGSNNELITNYIVIKELPTADFSYTSDTNDFNFQNLSTNWNSLLWDFGDMNTNVDVNPSHTYEMVGDYTVSLTATNECGDDVYTTDVESTIIPDVVFDHDKRFICTKQTVTYTDQTSVTPSSRLWTFEGGFPSTSTDSEVTVRYNDVGIFDVKLEVSLNGQNFDTISTQLIRVIDVPIADFEIQQLSDFEFQFNDRSDPQTGSYLWDFGDGNTSANSSPTHTYGEAGEYDVKLTITNLCGEDEKIITTSVLVSNSDIDQLSGINIYPNPNNGDFNVVWENPTLGPLDMEIFDLLGRTVYQESTSVESLNKFIMPVRFKIGQSGAYYIRIIQEEKSLVKAIVVQR